jgi:hypothetical protein
MSYGIIGKAPSLVRGPLFLCFQYSGWKVTDTPRECARLTRGFAVLGLTGMGDVIAIRALILLEPVLVMPNLRDADTRVFVHLRLLDTRRLFGIFLRR